MGWSERDLKDLTKRGLKVDGFQLKTPSKNEKIVKISIEKKTIEFWLEMYKRNGLISGFETEHKFHDSRKFRFDWAVTDLKIAIEYEGIHSKKSGHTTVSGFNKDVEKYNLALVEGWRVLRYTANNYKNFESDFSDLIKEPVQIGGYCELFKKGAIEKECIKPCKSCINKV